RRWAGRSRGPVPRHRRPDRGEATRAVPPSPSRACRRGAGRVSALSWSTSCRLEYQIAGDDDPDRVARTDRQCRYDLQLALDDLLTRLVDGILRPVAYGADQSILVAAGQFRTDRKQGREASGPHQIPPVVIHAILKPGVTGSVRTRQALQDDGAAAGQDQAIPDQQDAALAEGHTVIILADDARSLRDQQQAAGRAVIDVLGHLGRDLAGQIGTDAGDKRRRDHRPGLKDIGRCRWCDAIRGDGLPVHRPVEKSGMAILRWSLTTEIETREAGHGRSRRRSSPRARLEEHAAQTSGFFLGETTLLIWINGGRRDGRWRDRLPPILRLKYRATEIARQRRSQDRAGIVARQAGKPICCGAVLGRIEFAAARPGIAGLESVDQCPANA